MGTENMECITFIHANEQADLKLNGFLIELRGEMALIRRRLNKYSDPNKSYVVTHYSSINNAFYWSAYDLTLAQAVTMFYRDTLDDQDFQLQIGQD